jgi:hypothetical protein
MSGINEYLEACQYRKGFLEEQQAWLYQERHQYDLDVERLEGELDRVRQEMTGYLLPEVNDTHLGELEDAFGFDGLSLIKSDYDNRFAAAERRRVQLEAMDEVANYEQRILSARRLVDEVLPQRNELRSEFMYWSNSKWYAQLDRRGYFEEDYWPSFFNKFWDWRAVSLLMADIERDVELDAPFEDPEHLKRHYRKLQKEYNEVIPMYQDRVAQRDRIQELKDEHHQCVTAPERLLGELYSELGAKIIDSMRLMPQFQREEIASLDPNLNTFMKKELGLKKQVQYLKELRVSRVDANAQRVEQETQKIDRKIHKLEMKRMRGKHKWYSDDDLERMRNVKAEKWAKRRLKTEKIRRKVSEFNKYDKGSIQEDFLWWDLITNRSYGDDIYEVREHRQRFPDWDHRRHRDPWDDDDDHDDGPVNAFMDDAADDLVASMADNDDMGLFDAS